MNPSDLNLPSKFTAWRPRQEELADRLAYSDKRFICLNMPPGSGKSLIYMAALQILNPGRAAVLTQTKALQDQLGEFKALGFADIRGQANYVCALESRFSVTFAACRCGYDCHMKVSCEYYQDLSRAINGRRVTSNYAFWVTQNVLGGFLGQFDVVVMDEAHEVPRLLFDSLCVKLNIKAVNTLLDMEVPKLLDSEARWHRWAVLAHDLAQARLEHLKGSRDAEMDTHKWRTLVFQTSSLCSALYKLQAGSSWKFSNCAADVILAMPGRVDRTDVDRLLLSGAGKVWLTSATVTRRTLDLLYLGADEVDFVEVDSPFEVKRRPLTHVKSVPLSARSTDADLQTWIRTIDSLISSRTDRRGIIHSQSYLRAQFIKGHSAYGMHMYVATKVGKSATLDAYLSSQPPAILVSPCAGTGLDFPYDAARYQIVAKMPFPSLGDPLIEHVKRFTDRYLDCQVAQALIQMYGRGVRACDDWCETFILDDNFGWWLKLNRDLLPKWLLSALRVAHRAPFPISHSDF